MSTCVVTGSVMVLSSWLVAQAAAKMAMEICSSWPGNLLVLAVRDAAVIEMRNTDVGVDAGDDHEVVLFGSIAGGLVRSHREAGDMAPGEYRRGLAWERCGQPWPGRAWRHPGQWRVLV